MTTESFMACRAYVKAEDTVRALTRTISDNLSQCPQAKDRTMSLTAGKIKEGETHLAVAYRNNAALLAVGYASPGEAKGWAEMMACPFCKAAHIAIQERKAARQKLGAAKRAIRSAAKDLE